MGIEGELIEALSQLGAAGLIGLMWLTERRAAASRERLLEEAQAELRAGQTTLASVLAVVRQNTEALGALRASQAATARAIERLARVERKRSGGPG